MSDRPAHDYNGVMMEKGRENELRVIRWLEKRGNNVIDATQNRFMQSNDVDVVVTTPNSKTYLAEIKADHRMTSTGNICFETLRIYHQTGSFAYGWAIKSPADYLLYVATDTGDIYTFNFQKMKKRCAAYIHKTGRGLNAQTIETDTETTTHVFMIPLCELNGTYSKGNLNEGDENGHSD